MSADFQNAAGLMALDAIMQNHVQNLGYVDIDEFLDNHPYITTPERHMHITMRCVSCGKELSDDYSRQDPDFLAFHKCCHWCMQDVIAARVIPFTVFFHSRSVKRASFSDDVSGQCWQCGYAGQLHPFTLRNGETIHLCRDHKIGYTRHIARMAEKEEEKRAAIREMMAEHTPHSPLDLS